MIRKLLISVLMLPLALLAQEQEDLGELDEILYKFETDSIPNSGIRLKEVVLFQPLRFRSMKELREYVILRNRTLRVYPYAKLAADRLDTLSMRLEDIKNKRQKKIYKNCSSLKLHLNKNQRTKLQSYLSRGLFFRIILTFETRLKF